MVHGPAPGAWNMAVDETLAASPAAPPGLALRFYGWEAPTVSLGHHQDPGILERDAMRTGGYAWVRRPTGGTAVLHHGEITYALAARPGGDWRGGVADLVGLMGRCLAQALARWGVRAAGEPIGRLPDLRGPRAGAACFSGGGRGEVWVGGRKIAGLAARRWGRAVLVHGSMLRGPEHLALPGLMRIPPPGRAALREELLQRTVTLADLMTEPPDLTAMAGETAAVLGRALGARTKPSDLTSGETDWARALSPSIASGSP